MKGDVANEGGIAAEESFPQGFDTDFNHRGAKKFAWNSKRWPSAQAPHENTVRLNIQKMEPNWRIEQDHELSTEV